MFFVIGISAIAFFTLVLGGIAVVVYFEACSRVQMALRTRTSNRNARQEGSLDELLQAIADRRD